MLVFTSALFGAACHLQKVWETYNTHLTRTTIISTYFKYANIPFPSVTVCDNSRVDWHRVDKLWVLTQEKGIDRIWFEKVTKHNLIKFYRNWSNSILFDQILLACELVKMKLYLIRWNWIEWIPILLASKLKTL